jgi:hypothetical protein
MFSRLIFPYGSQYFIIIYFNLNFDFNMDNMGMKKHMLICLVITM